MQAPWLGALEATGPRGTHPADLGWGLAAQTSRSDREHLCVCVCVCVCVLLLLLSRFSRVRLCDPIDGSSPGPSVLGFSQARILEWAAISFSFEAGNYTITVCSAHRGLRIQFVKFILLKCS